MRAVMVDMKYHVASLVAVFLALGVGILVGSAVASDGALVEQQERMIDRLEADFARLKADRDALGARLAALEQALSASLSFEDMVARGLIEGELAGMRVAAVACGDAMPPEGMERIGRCVEEAGGELVRVVRIRRRLAPASADEAREVAASLDVSLAGAEAVERAVAEALAAYAALGEAGPRLDTLVSLGYAAPVVEAPAAAGGDAPGPDGRADAVVVMGGSLDPAFGAQDAGIPIVRVLKRLRVDVVGVEPWDVKVSHMGDYKREGITTVDCVDLPLGRLSLVYALAGQRGHFGIKGTAQSLVPDILRRR